MRDDAEREIDAVDERPQRRREWSGAWRSVLFPIVAVAAVVAAIWLLEGQPLPGSSTSGGQVSSAQAGDYWGVDTGPQSGSDGPRLGRPAPDFVLNGLDGNTVQLSSLKGKVVLVNFWATWCVPCKKEIPELVSIYERYQARGFEIVGVDFQETPGNVRSFVREWGMSYVNVLDPEGKVSGQYRLTGLPESFFIDRNGVLRDKRIGQMKEEFMECVVQALLEGGEAHRPGRCT